MRDFHHSKVLHYESLILLVPCCLAASSSWEHISNRHLISCSFKLLNIVICNKTGWVLSVPLALFQSNLQPTYPVFSQLSSLFYHHDSKQHQSSAICCLGLIHSHLRSIMGPWHHKKKATVSPFIWKARVSFQSGTPKLSDKEIRSVLLRDSIIPIMDWEHPRVFHLHSHL